MSQTWHEKYYAQLTGAKIQRVAVLADEDGCDSGWPTLKVVLTNGKKVTLEVSRDEEGNGPGFIFGLPQPEEDND